MRRTSRFLLPLLLLGATACGTTVPAAQLRAAGSGDGLSVPAEAGSSDAVTGSAPDATAAGQPSQAGAAPTSPTTARGSVPSASRATAVVSRGGPPVKVGLLYVDGAEQVAGSLGISGLSTGDASAQAKAVVAHLNATGGLSGRRIELHEARIDASSALSDGEGAYAQACASLTQDAKVSHVVSYVNLTQSRLACYAKRGVTLLDDQSAIPDLVGRRYAAVFGSPGELALGRAAQELVDALWRRGWLTPSSKVGTIVPDTTDGAEVETQFLLPALARHGLRPAVSVRSTGVDAANQNANVVKFRSEGVDRVIPLGQSPLFFMNAAESQAYRPAYAVNSGFGPGALLESAAPPAQLRGAAGIGWSKFLDIGSGTRPGPVSANETLCLALMRKSGQESTSATTQAFQVSLCNVLMFLKAAADRYGVVPDLLDRVRTQGLAFPPVDAFAIAMRPGRADGVSAYRDVAFDEACTCFQYLGGDRPTR